MPRAETPRMTQFKSPTLCRSLGFAGKCGGNVPQCSVSARPVAPVAGRVGLWPNTLTA